MVLHKTSIIVLLMIGVDDYDDDDVAVSDYDDGDVSIPLILTFHF